MGRVWDLVVAWAHTMGRACASFGPSVGLESGPSMCLWGSYGPDRPCVGPTWYGTGVRRVWALYGTSMGLALAHARTMGRVWEPYGLGLAASLGPSMGLVSGMGLAWAWGSIWASLVWASLVWAKPGPSTGPACA